MGHDYGGQKSPNLPCASWRTRDFISVNMWQRLRTGDVGGAGEAVV